MTTEYLILLLVSFATYSIGVYLGYGLWGNWCFKDPEYGWGEYDDIEYRIKPEPKPDVVNYYNVGCTKGVYRHDDSDNWDLKLTFDGETGELKSAEVLK